MKVDIYLQTARDLKEHKRLLKFAEGIRESNKSITVGYNLTDTYSPCDIAVISGSWKPRDKGHHIVRSNIATNSKTFICIETPLLNRRVHDENVYFRIGVDGFLNNQGKFVDSNANYDSNRLDALGINWPGWKNSSSGHIVLLLQLPGDASLRGNNIYEWAMLTIKNIRQLSDKKIIVRPHPLAPLRTGEEFYDFFFSIHKEKINNVEFADPATTSLAENLLGAYCTVSFTSGSAIDSVLSGIPTIAVDPGNFAFEISSNYIDDINNLKLSNQETINKWLRRLSYSQWTENEMRSGEAWKYIELVVNKTIEEKSLTEPVRKKK